MNAKLLQKVSIFTLLLVFGVVLPLYAYKVSLIPGYTDFDVYYRAALRAKQAQWSQVYTLSDGASPFRYAPWFIPLLRPLAELAHSQARLLWYFFQFSWFSVGFFFIYRTLKVARRLSSEESLGITCLSILMILRLCLDTFTIGQTSSLIFLCYCLGFYFWSIRRTQTAAYSLILPTLFKIGPGITYGVFLSEKFRFLKRAVLGVLGGVLVLTVFTYWNLGSSETFETLWKGWASIVVNDSNYYDASHYGSQSLKSFLLRGNKWGWFDLNTAVLIYSLIGIFICTAFFYFWGSRKPNSIYGRALFFSLGLFPIMWLMPETFKYSLTPLALPIALLLSSKEKSKLQWAALTFTTVTLSLAGKDIIGDTLFFAIQIYSLPLIATLLLGASTFEKAIKHSHWRNKSSGPIGPWETTLNSNRNIELSLLIPIELDSSTFITPKTVKQTLKAHWDYFATLKSSFEFVVIIYGNRQSQLHPVEIALQQVVAELQANTNQGSFQILRYSSSGDRGGALRHGFLNSKGKKLLITRIEQPCHPEFFGKSLELLKNGADLVRGNRRLLETRFEVPVRVLALVYGRHKLGLLFNALVRCILPIQATDTHSGIAALSWRLGVHAFAVQARADFLFDIELSLTAHANHWKEEALPILLSLPEEKSTRRMIREIWKIALGLPSLLIRFRKGCYGPSPKLTGITADDWGLSEGVNDGILKLAQEGIVRRVSIMANCPFLQTGLKELLAVPGIQLGIHFNLTYGKPLSKSFTTPFLDKSNTLQKTFLPSPGKVLIQWLKPGQDRSALFKMIQTELDSQLEHLQNLGIPIQYLDGHHHIHLVPGLLDCIAETLKKAGIKRIRMPYDSALWYSPKASLAILALVAKQKLNQLGFEYSTCIYPLTKEFMDQGMLRAKLSKDPSAEIIVHPACVNDIETLEFPDSYTADRVTEYRALQMLNY